MRERRRIWAFGTLSRFALVGLIGGGSAACSSDAMRFADPMSNPFASNGRSGGDPSMTGSLPAASASPAPVVRTETVQSAPLPAPGASASQSPPSSRAAVSPAPLAGGAAGWTARGGSSITVAAGDSLATISNRYGVPSAAILSANGLSNAAQVTPGRQIVIPVYRAGGAEPPTASPRPGIAAAPAQTKLRFVEGPKPAVHAKAEAEASKTHPRPGQAKDDGELAKLREKVAKLEAQNAGKAEKPAKTEPQKLAKAESTPSKPAGEAHKSAAASKPAPLPEPTKPAQKEPEQTASIHAKPADDANFRWPARGRIINGYGSSGNEGINIAVPDGTPVKAAEEGTVAYAGSDVKGYGNLVLVRHANGYVSAYAHNGEINVKPGEKVKRGQVIAKSGQSGNVTSPQLHFEIRKGATPVDPIPHLASN